jgi:hypothetical protein
MKAVPKPFIPNLVTRIVVWFVKFNLGLSESTLTLGFPFKRCEKAHFQVFFRKLVVSELKVRAYHFLMEEMRNVYGSIRATPSPRDTFVATTLYTRRLLLLSGPFPFPKAARGLTRDIRRDILLLRELNDYEDKVEYTYISLGERDACKM